MHIIHVMIYRMPRARSRSRGRREPDPASSVYSISSYLLNMAQEMGIHSNLSTAASLG